MTNENNFSPVEITDLVKQPNTSIVTIDNFFQISDFIPPTIVNITNKKTKILYEKYLDEYCRISNSNYDLDHVRFALNAGCVYGIFAVLTPLLYATNIEQYQFGTTITALLILLNPIRSFIFNIGHLLDKYHLLSSKKPEERFNYIIQTIEKNQKECNQKYIPLLLEVKNDK